MRETNQVESMRALIWLLAGSLILSGCSVIQGGLRGSDVNGEYQGFLEVEGEPVAFALELLQSGPSLSGRLESNAIMASGRGSLTRGDIHLEFQYGTDCRGVIVLTGEVLESGQRLLGEYRAEDCTGRTTGRFDLRR